MSTPACSSYYLQPDLTKIELVFRNEELRKGVLAKVWSVGTPLDRLLP